MLVKKIEKNGKIKCLYSSSTICASTYDTENKELTIIFNNGGQYSYPNVEKTDYTRFEIAESNGSVFNSIIKKKYTTFNKVGVLDKLILENLLTEVETLSSVEEKVETEVRDKILLEMMNTIIGGYIKNGVLQPELLEKLTNKLNETK